MGIEGIDTLKGGTDTVHETDQVQSTAQTEATKESELETARREHQEKRLSGMTERQELQTQVDATTTQTAGEPAQS